MHLPNRVRALLNALRVQGVTGFLSVMTEKRHKRERYERMLRDVPKSQHIATLGPWQIGSINIDDQQRGQIISRAEAMLRDENLYFSFPYRLRGQSRPWNYDPLEGLYWPERHYTEQKLHDEDTPHDVKIIWEINRFKDLPTLVEAAYLTKDKRFADEVEVRLISWIDDNPFANSINWASGLELGIRLLSWTSTLQLLREAGNDLSQNERIARSIYEHAAYLRAELSTDKIVRSNHLIGEAAGLFATARMWQYPEAEEHAATSRSILESEIIRQTFEDGATRESTTWYHGFVTDFFDIASRIADRVAQPFSKQYRERLTAMKIFRESMIQPDGTPARIGDGDDGWALYFEGGNAPWFEAIFGPSPDELFRVSSFDVSQFASIHAGDSALFIRGGAFGMGGNGSSSHAHDDILAPIVWLDALPVLVDPGTYVYNGDAKNRSRYRSEHTHNTFSLDEGSEAKQKLNFGWYQVRKPARLRTGDAWIEGSYGEWPEHTRRIVVGRSEVTIHDDCAEEHRKAAARLHLHPMWRRQGNGLRFTNERGDKLTIEVENWKRIDVETYDYSPSYRVQVPATKVILQTGPVRGKFVARLRVEKAPRPTH